jgi:Ankyrin repeats (3 copies)
VQTDGPNPSKPDLSPEQRSAFNDTLRAGIEQIDANLIKLALKTGADPNILMFAGIAYKPILLERVLDRHPLNLESVQLAVSFGADVNAANPAEKNKDGQPYAAIHCAYSNFNEAVTDFLIQKGASVDTPTAYNNTPLFRAIDDGKPELVSYYLQKGADPMRRCSANVFPLQELQKSDKFKAGKKSKLLALMMEHVRTATSNATPATEFNVAACLNSATEKGVELAHEIDVKKPLSLKHRTDKSARHFEL